MKLHKYPEYKDSGVEWLGEIPSHWEIVKLKRLFREKKKITNVDLPCGSISFGKVVFKNDEKIPEATKKSYQVVSKGNYLLNPLNLNYDLISLRIALSEIDVVVSSGYIVLCTTEQLDKEYFKWLLHRYDVAYMKTLGSGVRQTINYSDIGDSELIFPPLSEQTRIAQFLDQKTVLIDKAIAIKTKQIGLLKERRQIVIHQAVTRGVPEVRASLQVKPSLKLKDSGVEWIGMIPEHWEIEPIKYSLNGIVDCEHSTAPFVDEEEFLVVRTSNVKNGKLTLEDAKYTSKKGYLKWTRRGIPEIGDILLTREAPAGEACLVPSGVKLCLGQRMVWLKINRLKLNPQFAIYLIYSKLVRTYIDYLSSGSTVLHFNMSDIGNMPIMQLPLEEQEAIVEYLQRIDLKTTNAISLKEQEIEKLKEYKATLINSVVTGKVRV
ncbi:MAG: restriction endonuclease subunit S [Bacteroidota bacterium]|nr:restriction endonuclease subunit S [Bacteroidota bacterium]